MNPKGSALGAAVVKSMDHLQVRVLEVPAPKVQRDRTYASALALRDWFEARDGVPASLNVLTVGVHARRTRLLYEKAFGPGCDIGVLSVPDEDYDAGRWWEYSQGVRAVISETSAYLYARLFFEASADRERRG